MISLDTLFKKISTSNFENNKKIFEKKIAKSIKLSNLSSQKGKYYFKEFKTIKFPFYSMGKINTKDLFQLNEFIVFYFYHKFKDQYKNVADFGANTGLHSIILSKLGFNVTSYEPDPVIFKKLRQNLKLNKCKNVKIINKAIYTKSKNLRFVRVTDNLTGSHVLNYKKSYGNKKLITVKAENVNKIINNFDLIKMDIEGLESKIICSINQKKYLTTDFILEITNKKNLLKIFKFLKKNNLKSYSQKNNFNLNKRINHFPHSHHEGLLFVSQRFGNKIFS